MFSNVLNIQRPSEKSKSDEKADFEELLKRCNLICFSDFGPFLDIIILLKIEF